MIGLIAVATKAIAVVKEVLKTAFTVLLYAKYNLVCK